MCATALMFITLEVVRLASYDQELQSADSIESQSGMRVAFAAMPIGSGVYSHFGTLRDGLARRGSEMVGVSLGRATPAELGALMPDSSCLCIGSNEVPGIVASKAFVEWASDTKVACVISVVDPVINAATAFLPDPIAFVGQCYRNTLLALGCQRLLLRFSGCV